MSDKTVKRRGGVEIIPSSGKNGERPKKIHKIGTAFDSEGGRYQYAPSDELKALIIKLVQIGSTIETILCATKISNTNLLYEHYGDEIATGRDLIKMHALDVINDEMKQGNLDAAKFVLTRCGWGEPEKIEITTAEKKQITSEEFADIAKKIADDV